MTYMQAVTMCCKPYGILSIAAAAAASAAAVDVMTCASSAVIKVTGNVRLASVVVDGDAKCRADMLAPGAELRCTITKTTTEADFDSGLVSLGISAKGTPYGTNSTVAVADASTSAAVPIVARAAVKLALPPGFTGVTTSGWCHLAGLPRVVCISWQPAAKQQPHTCFCCCHCVSASPSAHVGPPVIMYDAHL
jgi:hypothetical protein